MLDRSNPKHALHADCPKPTCEAIAGATCRKMDGSPLGGVGPSGKPRLERFHAARWRAAKRGA